MCVCEFDVIKNTILLSIPLARRPNTISEDQANLDIPSTHLSPPDVTWRSFFLLLLLADDACCLCRSPFVSFATCGIPLYTTNTARVWDLGGQGGMPPSVRHRLERGSIKELASETTHMPHHHARRRSKTSALEQSICQISY